MDGDTAARTLIDPYGEQFSRDMLPPPEITRWVPRRKARIVCAIQGGMISRQEACELYGISDDELVSWEQLLEQHGPRALRSTQIQNYRRASASDDKSEAPS